MPRAKCLFEACPCGRFSRGGSSRRICVCGHHSIWHEHTGPGRVRLPALRRRRSSDSDVSVPAPNSPSGSAADPRVAAAGAGGARDDAALLGPSPSSILSLPALGRPRGRAPTRSRGTQTEDGRWWAVRRDTPPS